MPVHVMRVHVMSLRKHGQLRRSLRVWLSMCSLVLLSGIQSGCDVACTRVMTLEAQHAAEAYTLHSRQRRFEVENAKVPPYVAAIVKFRGLYGSGKAIDWRLLNSRERQLALVGLLLGDRDKHEDKMLAALIQRGGVDPFVADSFGLVPFALAFDNDRFAAKLLVAQLRNHAGTRPGNDVLCGLRANRMPGTLSALRAYCPCVPED